MSSLSSIDDDESWDSDEPPELDLDLQTLKTRAAEALSAPCISARRISRGTSHEIYCLDFSRVDDAHEGLIRSDFSCVARLPRLFDAATTAKEESEIATIKWLRGNTNIPVPQIFSYDLDPSNDVGAAYVLMERLPGQHLYQSWDNLPLAHKKTALSDIAAVLVQFASLQFDKIGSFCLRDSSPSVKTELGPVFNPCYDCPKGPFVSTEDYLHSFISADPTQSPELQNNFKEIRAEISTFLSTQSASFFQPSFGFFHADFDAQNMLFTDSPEGPRLTGLIDFEFSSTAPLYFLYDYPIFIQDVDSEKDRYPENALLRAHFVRQIFDGLPNRAAKTTFIDCINSKNFIINRFYECFMHMKCSEPTLLNSSTYYLKSLKDGSGVAYSGRLDYKPEIYSQEGELLLNTDVNVQCA